jgi:hypothetical protein
MNLRHSFSLILSIALVLSGCASSGRKMTRSSPEYQHAVQVFGGAENLFFLNVPSQGSINDSLVSAMAAAGPSALSRQIGKVVARAHAREVDLAVTGASPSKTRVSLIKGLEIHKGRHFPNLHVLYIGQPSDRQAVEEAVQAIGGQFTFAERASL